jgi:hypothetical protein
MKSSEAPWLDAKDRRSDLISNLINFLRATALNPLTALTQFTYACIAMGGFMFNQGLTVDEELALFSDLGGEISAQGRFTLEIISRALEPKGVLPLAPYLILAACYIFFYSIILGLHGLKHTWKSQIGFLVFILFPTNWLMQEWAGLAAALGIGLICSALAAYLTLESMQPTLTKASRAIRSILAVALLVVSMSTFQSQITVYLAIGLGVTLFSFPAGNSRKLRAHFSNLRTWFIHALASIAAYALTTKVVLLLTAQTIQHVNTYFRSPYFMLRTQPSKYILGNLEQIARTYLTPGYFYGNPLFALSLLLIGSVLLYFFLGRQTGASSILAADVSLRRGWQAWAGWLLLLTLPLALNVISSPNRIPMRAFFALPYVAWLVTMMWLEFSDRLKRLWSLRVGTILACLLIFQSLVAISNFYAARTFNQRSDQLVASTIASAIATSPDQEQPVTHLLTKGSLTRNNPYRTAWYSFAGASFFNWDNGNTLRISCWLKAMGLPELVAIKKENSQMFEKDFAKMNTWPQPGSIRIVGETLLVKLG